MSSRTARTFASLLLVAGLLLLLSAQTWVTATFVEANSPDIKLSISGRTLEPLGAGVAWALLAGTIAFRVTTGLLQRLVGFILVLLSSTSIYAAISSHGSATSALVNQAISQTAGRTVVATSSTETGLWLVACALSVVALVLSALLFLSPATSPSSSRYNRVPSNSAEAATQLTTWQALDAGIDPTQDQP